MKTLAICSSGSDSRHSFDTGYSRSFGKSLFSCERLRRTGSFLLLQLIRNMRTFVQLTFVAILTISRADGDVSGWNSWSSIWVNPEDSSQGIDIHYREEHPNSAVLAQWDWQLFNRCNQSLSVRYKWKDVDGVHSYSDSIPPGQTIGHSNMSGIYPEVEIVEVKFRNASQSSPPGNIIVFPGKKPKAGP